VNDGLTYKVQNRWLFHSNIKIKVPSFLDSALFDAFYNELETVNKLYNSYEVGSYFDKINKNAGSFVNVDEHTVWMLERIKYLSSFFHGEYDITIMPLLRLWQFYTQGSKRLPTLGELENTRNLININNIEIEGNTVRIAPGQEIITASFIKAYAVDRLMVKMQEKGITDAIVNAGGSTIAMVNNLTHPFWRIRVQHSDDEKTSLFMIKVANMNYSTSAQSKTFVEIEGKKYGHILSPVTGYPAANRQVGILTKESMVGDIVSTGAFNLSPTQFKETMEHLSRDFYISGFLMDSTGKITFAGDFEKYII